nr:helix-turn-helix domain-containing protein [Pedobacter sp. SYSU D00823]
MECEGDADNQGILVLPDACVELFINYTSTPIAIIDRKVFNSSIVNSRMSKPNNVKMRKGSGCIAVCFYPGMAYKFFHLPMHTITDQTVELSELWKHHMNELEDQLLNQINNEDRATVIQEFLLKELEKCEGDNHIDLSLILNVASTQLLSVKQVSEAMGITQRHLSRKFQEIIGLSPKEYFRVNRFLYSLHYYKQYPSNQLTRVAHESGYYDQSHFIRDCKEFSGVSPKELFSSSHILY